MGKVPYIPLYIGDWEQDTNCLSLEAEAAWLKIIFKMFKNEKSGIYKTSTKALQNLWKCSDFVMQNLIQELRDNNICGLEETGGYVVFTNRRMVREVEISKKRTKAVQNRYKRSTNTPTKDLQNPEYENEYDIEVDNENEYENSDSANSNFFIPQCCQIWYDHFPNYSKDKKKDFTAMLSIVQFMGKQHKIDKILNPENHDQVFATLKQIAASLEPFWQNKPLSSISNNIQEFYNNIKNPINGNRKNGKQPTGGDVSGSSLYRTIMGSSFNAGNGKKE